MLITSIIKIGKNMKIIALWGSNSSTSINKALIHYVTSLIKDVEILNLTEYNLPLYSFDIEKNKGFPESLKALDEKLKTADKLILSVAEHNGNLTAFFKSNIDWLSRYDREFLKDKKILLLSASPGKMGAANSLKIAKNTLPHFGAEIIATYSVGDFYNVFQDGKLVDDQIASDLKNLVKDFITN